MGKILDITGERFGGLRVLCFDKIRKRKAYWICECDCGNVSSIRGDGMKNGHTSCCFVCGRKKLIDRNTIHGMSHSPEFKIWHGMIERCIRDSHSSFKYYGLKGIKVCDEWLSFEKFYKDMGSRPKGMTLDRINSSGDYCKENCRWATVREQNNNRSSNHKITFKDKTQNLTEWANENGILHETLSLRLRKYGWSIERALTTPVRAHKQHGY